MEDKTYLYPLVQYDEASYMDIVETNAPPDAFAAIAKKAAKQPTYYGYNEPTLIVSELNLAGYAAKIRDTETPWNVTEEEWH